MKSINTPTASPEFTAEKGPVGTEQHHVRYFIYRLTEGLEGVVETGAVAGSHAIGSILRSIYKGLEGLLHGTQGKPIRKAA